MDDLKTAAVSLARIDNNTTEVRVNRLGVGVITMVEPHLMGGDGNGHWMILPFHAMRASDGAEGRFTTSNQAASFIVNGPNVARQTVWPPDAAGCHAQRDGDCIWPACPQTRDGEPTKTGRHCPLDTAEDRE